MCQSLCWIARSFGIVRIDMRLGQHIDSESQSPEGMPGRLFTNISAGQSSRPRKSPGRVADAHHRPVHIASDEPLMGVAQLFASLATGCNVRCKRQHLQQCIRSELPGR